MEMNLNVSKVRYSDHSDFEDFSREKLDNMLSRFSKTPQLWELKSLLSVQDFNYYAVIQFLIESQLPVMADFSVIEVLPEDQKIMIATAHDSCSDQDFWKKVQEGQIELFHFVEHCVLAVYTRIFSGIIQQKFEAGFMTFPIELDGGDILCETYILQDYKIDPSVFMDITTLALEYANRVVTGQSMDVFGLIDRKIARYSSPQNNGQSEGEG